VDEFHIVSYASAETCVYLLRKLYQSICNSSYTLIKFSRCRISFPLDSLLPVAISYEIVKNMSAMIGVGVDLSCTQD